MRSLAVGVRCAGQWAERWTVECAARRGAAPAERRRIRTKVWRAGGRAGAQAGGQSVGGAKRPAPRQLGHSVGNDDQGHLDRRAGRTTVRESTKSWRESGEVLDAARLGSTSAQRQRGGRRGDQHQDNELLFSAKVRTRRCPSNVLADGQPRCAAAQLEIGSFSRRRRWATTTGAATPTGTGTGAEAAKGNDDKLSQK